MKKVAFTMAEILISMTIIGIVAAITIPALQGNINEKTWATQRKAIYSRISQAVSLLPALNGYGIEDDNNETINNAALVFITNGLSKVMKINNICDNSHLKDCGFADKIQRANGDLIELPKSMLEIGDNLDQYSGYNMKNTKAAAFETLNGESILTFYNPECDYDNIEYADIATSNQWYFRNQVCVNFIFDMNGLKSPNQVGKDIGVITVFYPQNSTVVAPRPALNDASDSISQVDAGAACRAQNENYKVPTITELMSVYTNNELFKLGNKSNGYYWSSSASPVGDNDGLLVRDYNGRMSRLSKLSKNRLHCFER